MKLWGRRVNRKEVERDPLVVALQQEGIEVNKHWLFSVECYLAEQGVESTDTTYAVAVYKGYADEMTRKPGSATNHYPNTKSGGKDE